MTNSNNKNSAKKNLIKKAYSKFKKLINKICDFIKKNTKIEICCRIKNLNNKFDFKEFIIKCFFFWSITISIVSLVLFINQRYHWYILPYKAESYHIKLFNDISLFIFVNSFIIFIITGLIKFKIGKTFNSWSEVFFEYDDEEQKNKILVILRALYLPVLIYIILSYFSPIYLPDSSFFKLSIFGFFGVWITFLSFIVAVKIYFEVKRTKTKTLKEYLENAIKALEEMENNHTLVFVAPTLFVGALEKETKALSHKFRELLISKSSKLGSGIIKIAILNFNDFFTHKKKFEIEASKEIPMKENENFSYKRIQNLIKLFETFNVPYFAYHHHFLKMSLSDDTTINDAQFKWFKDHFEFLESLCENRKIEIIHLKTDNDRDNSLYNLNVIGDNKPNALNEGFFCIANYDSGFLYMGEYKVQELGYVPFYGSWLKDKNVMNIQRKFIEKLIIDNKIIANCN